MKQKEYHQLNCQTLDKTRRWGDKVTRRLCVNNINNDFNDINALNVINELNGLN